MSRSRVLSLPALRRRGFAHVALLVGLAGFSGLAVAGAYRTGAVTARTEEPPTFARDVAPILYKNCASCHRPGGIGPFSVLDYDTVASHARAIRKAVSTGYMPPWHAAGPHGVFANDRRLSAEDKKTIVQWVDGGAKPGDPKDLPPRPVFAAGWEIGSPDTVVTMPEPFHVPAEGTVEYQYFEVPTGFTEDRWVQALEILPGARDVVHHVIVFARAPEAPAAPTVTATAASTAPAGVAPQPVLVFDANQKIDRETRTDPRNPPPRRLGSIIGGTAPGTNVLRFPEGTAVRIRAGSVLVFQMHYTANGHERHDRTAVGFRFAKTPPSEQVLSTAFYNAQFVLPAGAKDVMVPSTLGFNEAVRIYGLLPHTHVRGTRWHYTLEKPDGTSQVILDVPRYDFNWQTYYLFAKPLDVPAGARIVASAWYDNSADNPDNPDATIPVRWGDQTWEEMQYTGILYSVPSRRLTTGAK
jgi:mono/diheme cytochrome c family protein